MFLILLAFFAWSTIRQQHPDYTHYTEAQCSSVHKTWLNQYANKEYCFFEVAQATKDPSVCNNLNLGEGSQGTYTKGFCLDQVAEITKDPAICEMIPPNTPFKSRDSCLSFIHTCEKVLDPGEKKTCLESRAYAEAHPF